MSEELMEGAPNLGLATTRELMEELLARGGRLAEVAPEIVWDEAVHLRNTMAGMMASMSKALLDYRTVEGQGGSTHQAGEVR